jgi:tyrosyl-tRNA synthetase
MTQTKLSKLVKALDVLFKIRELEKDPAMSHFVPMVYRQSHTEWEKIFESDFSKRFKSGSPICLHEFIYPLMQGYDSLQIKADVEIGGTDQIFNLLVGRALQKEEGQEQQVVLTVPLLVGTDGVKKMSKSYGNVIGISESPSEIFGKVMSISDELMWQYYELLSQLPLEKIEAKKQLAQEGNLNPKDAKIDLAKELVSRFYSEKEAEKSAEEFNRIFHSRETPSDIEEVKLKLSVGKISVIQLLVISQCVDSNSQAKRMIREGAVTIDGKKISDIMLEILTKGEILLKVGKRKFKKIIFKA